MAILTITNILRILKDQLKTLESSIQNYKDQAKPGLRSPGVDLKAFSTSLRKLLTSEGNNFSLNADEMLSFVGVGRGIFSGYLHLFAPDKFPAMNTPAIDGVKQFIGITNGQKRKAAKQGKENLGITVATKNQTLSNYISWFYLLSEIKENLGIENSHELDWFTLNIGKTD